MERINKLKKIKFWSMAWYQDYPFFRVIYKDGKRTTTLYQQEAIGLRNVYNGKLIIDYEYADYFLKQCQ